MYKQIINSYKLIHLVSKIFYCVLKDIGDTCIKFVRFYNIIAKYTYLEAGNITIWTLLRNPVW